MKQDEITKQKWKISKELKILGWRPKHEGNIERNQQECGFLIDRWTDKIFVDCSDQRWITKLGKSELFTLETVYISEAKDNPTYIVWIRGYMPMSSIIVKKSARNPFTVRANGSESNGIVPRL